MAADLTELYNQRKQLDAEIEAVVKAAREGGESIIVDGKTYDSAIDYEGTLPDPKSTDYVLMYRKDKEGDIVASGEIQFQEIVDDFGADAENKKQEAIQAGEQALTDIQAAVTNALNSIGQNDASGARGAAITSISAALTSALESIGQTDNAGARGAALTAIATALANALAAIGQTNDAGARGQAIAAISAALTSTLSAIAAKETQVNSDLDSKLASANSTIDGKVSAAEESASAAAGSASDASGSATLAEKWASNPEDTPVTGEGDTAKYSSYHWAQKAMDAANSPLASEASAGRIRATSNASYVRPEGMTEPVAYTIEAVNSIKTALQTGIDTLEGKFTFADSTYEAVVTPEQTA